MNLILYMHVDLTVTTTCYYKKTINPKKIYNSVVFNIFTDMLNYQHNSKTLSSSQKETPMLFSYHSLAPVTPTPKWWLSSHLPTPCHLSLCLN